MPLKGKRSVFKALDDLELSAKEDVQAVGISLFSQIIEGTPVNTGRARNNWFLSYGTPSNAKGGRPNKTGAEPLRRVEKLDINKANGRSIFLTNNLPYIERLEYDGHSSQARIGWVRRAIKRTRINIKRGRL